ncbi:MAG: hypothetical protein AAFY88_08905, partial [Acidobacteriota bacterium]
EELLRRGVDFEKAHAQSRKTPLLISIEEHFYGITERLLGAGADPNRRDRRSSPAPLARVALALPFDRGAVLKFRFGQDEYRHEPWAHDLYPVEDPDLQDDHDPVLEAFGTRKAAGVIRQLCERGAAVDAVDPRGRTALMRVCSRRPPNAVERAEALLDCGADPTIRDAEGRDAADHAADLALAHPEAAARLLGLLQSGNRD